MDALPAKPISSGSPQKPRSIRRKRERDLSARVGSPLLTPNGKSKGKEKIIPTGPRVQSAPTVSEVADFIPLADSASPPPLSEAEKKIQQRERDHQRNGREGRRSPPVREWDMGKVRGREPSPNEGRRVRERSWERDNRESSGRKRKYDVSFDDGYENKKQRTDAASRKAPWLSDMDWKSCRNVAEMLHCEVEAFVKYISPTPVEDEVRGLVVKLISRAVTAAFPDAQVIPFGSFETKLYLPLGDIDLVILSESMAYSNKVNVLHALANTIKRAQLADKVTIIAKAKVPIVKFITTHGRFSVDISINQSNGVVAGRIINGFLEHLHSLALRSLVMVTKTFLSQRSMNEVFSGGLGSYSIVCLAVNFLQMHPKIRRGEIDAEMNLGVLVMEFFELYGCYFNYEEVGISVRDGGTYFSKRQRGWLDLSKNHLLSIEDPADPSNDISRGTFAIAKVRTTFAGAHGILTAAAYLRAGIISARREGRSVNLRGHYSPEDMSILSSVMGVTQETINHRKLVQEVYDKRTLHNMLGISAKETVAASMSNGLRSPLDRRNARPSSSTKRAAETLQSAWEQADIAEAELSETLEYDRKKNRWKRQEEDQDEEDGRYDIQRWQSSRKRRKTGGQDNTGAVFMTDDEDGEVDELISEYVFRDNLDERAAPGVEDFGLDLTDGLTGYGKVAERRNYWLSKANVTRNGESE